MARFAFIHLPCAVTRAILSLVLLTKFCVLCAQKQPTETDSLFDEAEALFNNPRPTAQSDELALSKYEQVCLLYQQKNSTNQKLIDAYFKAGILYQSRYQYAKSLQAYRNSIQTRRKLTPKVDSSYFKSLLFTGNIFYQLNNPDSAYWYYYQAEQLANQYPSLEEVDRIYNSMGALLYDQGNYKQCINYFEKALTTLKHAPVDQNEKLINYQNNIAILLCRLNRYEEGLKKYREILKYKNIPITIYQNIGYTYLRNGQYDSALVYLSKIDPDKYNGTNKIKLYNNYGNTYIKLRKPAQAFSYFDQAIQINSQQFRLGKNTPLAKSYIGKGQVYELQNQPNLALQQYQQAVISLHYTFNDQLIKANPKDFGDAVSVLDLFEALKYKANALQALYSKNGNVKELEIGLQTYQTAIRLADEIRKSYDSDEAKLFFTNTIYPVYEEAIHAAFQLYAKTKKATYCEEAFALAEQSKAAILSETLHDLEIKQIPGIPASLVKKEKELKQKLTRLNIKLSEAHDSTEVSVLRNQIRDGEIALARTIRKFEDNKAYYQLKYTPHSAKIADIQRALLDDQTALIEYFIGKNQLYTFVITSKEQKVLASPLDQPFKRAISQLSKALRQPAEGTHYAGQAHATKLYQKLIAPIQSALAGKERLIIIPDAELNYLPFEVLVSQREESRYLIEDFDITYAYSGTLLQNALQQPSGLGSGTLLAMAPFATTEKGSITRADASGGLAASRAEVQDLGGDIWLGQRATKALFLKTAGSYGIIHLATHAKADNDEPLKSYISFFPHEKDSASDYRLYAQELYNLSLQSVKLVVLSACETGDGQLVRGEGIMSLARAFAYAGCPNIVTTLWKADDRATADITIRLHAYLKKGYAKDEALRQAKLDYLTSDVDSRLKAPYYWANLVFIGNNEPVYPAPLSYVWVVLGVITLVTVAILTFYYQRKNRKPTLVRNTLQV